MSDEIPSRNLVPWCYVKIDGSGATTIKSDTFRVLLCAQGEQSGVLAEEAATEERAKAVLDAFRRHNSETSIMVFQHTDEPTSEAWWADLQNYIDGEKFSLIAFPSTCEARRVGTFLSGRASVNTQLEGIGLQVVQTGQGRDVAKAQNCPWSVVFEAEQDADQLDLLGASLAGLIAASAQSDPALPFEGLRLEGFEAPQPDKRPGKVKRGELLDSGVSTLRHDLGGNTYIERVVSTEQKNEGYKSINTVLVLSVLRSEFRNYFSTKFQRFKLASDMAKISANQRILTPSVARAEAISLGVSWLERGLIQDLEGFKKGLKVGINPTDRARIDFSLTPELIKQLVTISATVRFT